MSQSETYEKPLPSSPETETAIIGQITMENSLIEEAIAAQIENDFYLPSCRIVFSIMIELHREQMPLDVIVMCDRLKARGEYDKVGGMIFFNEVTNGLPHTTTLKPYIKILKEKASKRWIAKEGARLTAAGLDDNEDAQAVFTSATERFTAMREKSLNGNNGGGTLLDLAYEVTDHLYAIRAGINTAVKTGLSDLDRLTAGGIRPGELWGIAARSSRGKSSILVQILLNMAKAGHPVVLFSLETQALSVALRILSAETGVAMNSLRAPGRLRDVEIDELIKTVNKRFDIPLWIYTKGYREVEAIHRQIQSLNRKLGPEKRLAAVGIDWYGKLNARARSRESRTQELKYVADYLQQEIAIGEDVGLIVPAQFNRSGWNSNDPGPGNVDGGEAYHDACDLFAVLNTETTLIKDTGDRKLSNAKLTVFKQRNGPVALGKEALKMVFDRHKMQFVPRLEDAGEEVTEPVSPTGYIPTEKERADFL